MLKGTIDNIRVLYLCSCSWWLDVLLHETWFQTCNRTMSYPACLAYISEIFSFNFRCEVGRWTIIFHSNSNFLVCMQCLAIKIKPNTDKKHVAGYRIWKVICILFWSLTITHDALDLTIQGPTGLPPNMGTSRYREPSAPPNMFKLVQPHCTGTHPRPQHIHEACTVVGKRAVCILLECFLVL